MISSDPEDTLTAFVVTTVGADHVMWASDFPHPDAHYPDAVDVFTAGLGDTPRADVQAVLWDTPARFYRLENRFG